jgi:hypothetical protein
VSRDRRCEKTAPRANTGTRSRVACWPKTPTPWANAPGRTVYDSVYLALAIRLETRMITADDRLVTAMAAFPLAAAHIELVQRLER